MKYRVVIAPPALYDAAEAHEFIARDSPVAAHAWSLGLLKAIDSLANFPRRCRVAPESRHFSCEIRHLLYHSHRILFTISGDEVLVLYIHHAARKPRRGRGGQR